MTDLKKKILDLFNKGLKAKEISEKLNVEYKIVRNTVKQEQRRRQRKEDPQPFRDGANKRYPQYAEKAIKRSRKRYSEKKDEIRAQIKEDRKKNPEKYRLKRQKEKAKDPEGFKRKKNANWAENFPKKKLLVFKYYSKELSESNIPCCNCCALNEYEFLEMDHIIPKREMERDSNMFKIGFRSKLGGEQLLDWIIRNNFPKGFQILCSNCNFAKGKLGKCPHEK